LLWLGFVRVFTVTMKHRHRKCNLFIYLLIYRAQREHKTNMVEIKHIQIISIFDTKKFFGRIGFESDNFLQQ